MRTVPAIRILIAAALLSLSFPLLAAIQLVAVASGLSSPVFVGNAKDGSNRLFIVEQGGFIQVLQPGSSTPALFLDIHTKVLAGGERGLLGLAFHPRYPSNGRFYVFYTRAGDGSLVIAQYQVSTNPNVADSATEIILLTIPHPTNANHNGGMLAFGPDGFLYAGTGDGGSGNDPPNNAQNINSLLGKILRIDVDHPDVAAGTPYSSPSDNPFVNAGGRGEIFAFGMRNPWRFSFDRSTGQQWVGDVGQDAHEEVDTPIARGGNYGWRVYEGMFCSNNDPGLCVPANYLFPVFDYGHTGGRCSITGGYVYRGTQNALPPSTYVYGDYCTGEIFGWDGTTQRLLLDTSMNISSFGEDERGELYVVDVNGAISKFAPGTAASGSVVNASFEVPALSSGGYQYTPGGSGVGWTFDGGSGVQRNGSAWGAATAPDGNQTAFIQGKGTIAQAITLGGDAYTLTFNVAQRSGQIQPVRVSVDGAQIGALVTPPGTSFTTVSINFSVASAGAHTLAFVGTDPADKSTFLDAVAVAAGPSAWNTFGRDAHHSALSTTASQPLSQVHWQTPLDLQPQYSGSLLLIHYGSPLVTASYTVIIPVKTGATDGFQIEARAGSNGALQWSIATDYVLPPHSWIPVFGPALTSAPRLYFPGAGGTIYFRDQPDAATGASGQIAFFGISNYQANPQAYNESVMINTPLTVDPSGNIYFGFQVIGSTPLGLTSGIARIGASGQGTWTPLPTAQADPNIAHVPHNSAPALSTDLGTVYVAASEGSAAYLVALDSTSLVPLARVRLIDPKSGFDALLSDNGSASPTVGTDGDVYFGVLDNPSGENHGRGWLLHFNSSLSQSKTPGAFGWDDTPSLVPAQMVPSYQGSSPYLLMTKYNNYRQVGGDGQNKIAVLDPHATQTDPVTQVTVMKEVLTMVAPTPDPNGGVKEWCINSAAVDPFTKSILANNEDGKLYRWDLTTNTLSQTVVLTAGLGEAYTTTVIGADGQVYATNNAILFAVGQ